MTDPQPIPIRSFSGQRSDHDENPTSAIAVAWPAVLRALREARGLTQEGWAAYLGVSDVTVRRWERDAAVPTAAAEVALLAWCRENNLFQRFRTGPLAGLALTPELLRDLLAEGRLAARQGRTAPAGETVRATAATAARVTASVTAPPVVLHSPSPEPAPRLPAPLTRLIGREIELQRVCDTLLGGRARLVTLTGPGGTGKTRLALAAATEAAGRFDNRAWFVPLEALTDPALVLQAIVKTLKGDVTDQQPLLEAAVETLSGGAALLVLDNFEQLFGAAGVVNELLSACPALAILVTSRAALRLQGEQELPVPPLAVPPATEAIDVEAAGRYAAVELFLERAVSVQPDFQLTAANARMIARICARLDGLPLALELAAVWVKVLSPAALLARLEQALPLPSGRSRDLPARRQTLRAAINWSYDLLTTEEQALFRRLAVFSGGFTLAVAEGVAGGADVEAAEVLPLLAQLVDQSLVVADTAGEEPRYRLLETIRQFAIEQLEAAGETVTQHERHRAWYLAFAEETANAGVPGMDRLEGEHDNLRAALAWRTEERGDAENAEIRLRLVATLWRFWQVRGYLAEGRRWLAGALEQAGPTATIARARALNGAGSLAYYEGDMRAARDYYQAAYDSRTAIGDQRGGLAALSNLAISAYALGDYPIAYEAWERGLALARQLDDRRNIALALGGLSLKAQSDQHHALAMALLEEAHTIWLALGDTLWLGRSLGNMGAVAFYGGDMERARALTEETIALTRKTGNRRNLAMALLYRGRIAARMANIAAARRDLGESLDVFAELNDRVDIARVLEALGTLAGVSGRPRRAALLFGAAEGIRVRHGQPHFPHEQTEFADNVAAARARADEAEWAAGWAAGRALSMDEAVIAACDGVEER